MGLFILRRIYDDEKTAHEWEMWNARQQNKALLARIKVGEDYRHTLEQRIEAYRVDNGTLYASREEDRKRLQEAEKTIRELRLQLGSMEAMWCQRGEADDSVCAEA